MRARRSGMADPSTVPAMVWSVSVPLTLVESTLIGFWLMAAPPILGSTGAVAMAEVARPARYLNVALGAWLATAPFVLGGATTGSTVSDVAAGLVLIALSIPRGTVRETYAGWQRYIV